MTQPIATDPNLELFLRRVLARIQHHAPGIQAAFPIIIGLVTCYGKDFELQHSNLGAFTSKKTGRRFVFGRSPCRTKIDLRLGSLHGPTLHQIDDTTIQALPQIFANL